MNRLLCAALLAFPAIGAMAGCATPAADQKKPDTAAKPDNAAPPPDTVPEPPAVSSPA